MSSHGAMRNDGRCMLDVRHVVELRCGRQEVAGVWCDVWVAQGEPYERSHFALHACDALRAAGGITRIRPVLL